jgi:hypothetical protein
MFRGSAALLGLIDRLPNIWERGVRRRNLATGFKI